MKQPTVAPSAWTIAFGVMLGVFLLCFVNLFSDYGANDVRAVCQGHEGVAQVSDTTFFAGHGVATVVCRDGWVGQIK